MAAGVLRTVPLAGELTASLISRVAARYGLPTAGVLRLWTCRNSPARHESGGVRADAEVVLNEAGRGVLAELCGMGLEALARALLGFTVDDRKISTGPEVGAPQARWRAAGTVAGPAAFGCRLCTARRTGRHSGRCGICRANSGCVCGTASLLQVANPPGLITTGELTWAVPGVLALRTFPG